MEALGDLFGPWNLALSCLVGVAWAAHVVRSLVVRRANVTFWALFSFLIMLLAVACVARTSISTQPTRSTIRRS